MLTGGLVMAKAKSEETKVIMMSSHLMKLYEVRQFGPGGEFSPITFYNPQECLNMMVDVETEEDLLGDAEVVPDKGMHLEKQWGELELRLSFFTKALNWQ
jgi:hypothetical protein